MIIESNQSYLNKKLSFYLNIIQHITTLTMSIAIREGNVEFVPTYKKQPELKKRVEKSRTKSDNFYGSYVDDWELEE